MRRSRLGASICGRSSVSPGEQREDVGRRTHITLHGYGGAGNRHAHSGAKGSRCAQFSIAEHPADAIYREQDLSRPSVPRCAPRAIACPADDAHTPVAIIFGGRFGRSSVQLVMLHGRWRGVA